MGNPGPGPFLPIRAADHAMMEELEQPEYQNMSVDIVYGEDDYKA